MDRTDQEGIGSGYQLLTKLVENEVNATYVAYSPKLEIEFLLKITTEDDYDQSLDTVPLYTELQIYKLFISQIPELQESVPEYLGSNIDGNNIQLFLEYIPYSTSLYEWLHEEGHSLEIIVRVILDLFTVINIFSNYSFIHYDLGNSDNVLVTQDTSIKIIDFDWSKKYSDLEEQLEISNPKLEYPSEEILSYIDSYAIGRFLWKSKSFLPDRVNKLLDRIHPNGKKIFTSVRLTLDHFNMYPNSFYTAEEYIRCFNSVA